jgi:hypothetical protein
MEYIPVPDQPTPAWFTAVLRQSGVLRHGTVTAIDQQPSLAFNSQTDHIRLHYSTESEQGVPTKVVLKRNRPEAWAREAGIEEVKFYNLVASLEDHPPIIIPCYAAAYDETSGNSYLLLQDLSETHAPPLTRDQQINIVEGVPSAVYIEAVVDTLARLHAYWWDHPSLDTGRFSVGYWSRNAERFAQYLQRRSVAWESLITQEHDWFPDDLRRMYEQLLAHLPNYWEHYLEPRFRTKTNLTLIHGDAYFANFLCPRDPATGTTYLLDWQSPVFDLGGYDLANLMATFWTPEQRGEEAREEKILQHYHSVLQGYGVKHYTWEDLVTDYRSGLIFWLLMPVQDRYGGAVKAYWWPKMLCLVGAFRDWYCEDMLGIIKEG